jgi:Na+/H+ antiporter NhaC
LSSRPCLYFFSAFDSGVLLSFFFRSSPFFFSWLPFSFFLVFLFLFFFVLSFLFLFFSFSPLGQHPRLLYSLYMALFRNKYYICCVWSYTMWWGDHHIN